MKKIFFTIFFFLLFASRSFAETTPYVMILNAEEKASYIHLFKVTEDENHFPLIDEIYTGYSSATLALFKNNPTLAFQSIKSLLDATLFELQKLKLSSPLPLQIFGTDNMRLLPKETQLKIFSNIKDNITLKYQKYVRVTDASTLSGKTEALYRWLAVNYVAKHFQNQTPTLGIIDVGNITTQIAFAIPQSKKPIDEVMLTLNGKNYIIFTKNFLGLGLKEMEDSINADADAKYCYPTHAPFNKNEMGEFNLINCSELYLESLKKYNVRSQILPLSAVSHFIVFASIYPIYQFFGKEAFLDKENFEDDILAPICGNTWDILKDAYADLPEHALLSYCANALFLSDLFFNTLQLKGSQFSIQKTMNGTKIDWTLGAVLASFVRADVAK